MVLLFSKSDDGLGNFSIILSSSNSKDSINNKIKNPIAILFLNKNKDINHG